MCLASHPATCTPCVQLVTCGNCKRTVRYREASQEFIIERGNRCIEDTLSAARERARDRNIPDERQPA